MRIAQQNLLSFNFSKLPEDLQLHVLGFMEKAELRAANRGFFIRTSTPTLTYSVPPRSSPSTLWWTDSSLHLSFKDDNKSRLGVCVGVPAGSSQTIGS
jgi:hypothetical protein